MSKTLVSEEALGVNRGDTMNDCTKAEVHGYTKADDFGDRDLTLDKKMYSSHFCKSDRGFDRRTWLTDI